MEKQLNPFGRLIVFSYFVFEISAKYGESYKQIKVKSPIAIVWHVIIVPSVFFSRFMVSGSHVEIL